MTDNPYIHSTTESLFCPQCGEVIRWHSQNETRFGSVFGKLKHHLNNDVRCCREQKLSQLLGEEPNLLVKHFK